MYFLIYEYDYFYNCTLFPATLQLQLRTNLALPNTSWPLTDAFSCRGTAAQRQEGDADAISAFIPTSLLPPFCSGCVIDVSPRIAGPNPKEQMPNTRSIFYLIFNRGLNIVDLICFVNNVVFWNVTLCRSGVNRSFGETYRLHCQGEKIRELGILAVTSN
jgi:hypothetical protein